MGSARTPLMADSVAAARNSARGLLKKAGVAPKTGNKAADLAKKKALLKRIAAERAAAKRAAPAPAPVPAKPAWNAARAQELASAASARPVVSLVAQDDSDDDDEDEAPAASALPAGFFDGGSEAAEPAERPQKRAREDDDEGAEGEDEEESALPAGFFDDKSADAKAHGRDLEAEMQEKLSAFEADVNVEKFEQNLKEATGEREIEEQRQMEEVTDIYMDETVTKQIGLLGKVSELRARQEAQQKKGSNKPSKAKAAAPVVVEPEADDDEDFDMEDLLGGDDWRAKC